MSNDKKWVIEYRNWRGNPLRTRFYHSVVCSAHGRVRHPLDAWHYPSEKDAENAAARMRFTCSLMYRLRVVRVDVAMQELVDAV